MAELAIALNNGVSRELPYKPGDLKTLNSEQQKIADMFGNSAEDLQRYGKKETLDIRAVNSEQAKIAEMFVNSAEDLQKYGRDR